MTFAGVDVGSWADGGKGMDSSSKAKKGAGEKGDGGNCCLGLRDSCLRLTKTEAPPLITGRCPATLNNRRP